MWVMSIPLRRRLVFALNCTPPGTLNRLHSSGSCRCSGQAPTSQRNVPPLHTAQAVHEVVAEEYRIVESVNYELATSWRLIRQQTGCVSSSIFGSASHKGLAHNSHCSRAFLPGYLQAWPCVSPVTVSETAHSPWSPRQVASGALPGSSPAWPGSAFCGQGFAEGKASPARSASLDACPLALPALSVSGLLSECLKLELFFLQFFSSQSGPVD